jgi:hypothetical protein
MRPKWHKESNNDVSYRVGIILIAVILVNLMDMKRIVHRDKSSVGVIALMLWSMASLGQGMKFSIETDPSTFVFKGYSAHIRIQPPNCEHFLIGVGTYAMEFPDPLVDLNKENRDEGWNVKIKSAYGLFGEYYFREANHKWFIGEQFSIQNYRVKQENVGDAKFSNLLALTYIGYSWHPFEFPLYIKPWAGLGYTWKVDGSTRVGDSKYDIAPLFPFVTFHIGYTF